MRSNKKKDNDTNDDDTSIWALATVGLIGAAIGGIVGYFMNSKENQTTQDQSKQNIPVQKNQNYKVEQTLDETEDVLCPITNAVMTDPYIITKCGHTFQKEALLEWFKKQQSCPQCRTPATSNDIKPNITTRNIIQNLQFKK